MFGWELGLSWQFYKRHWVSQLFIGYKLFAQNWNVFFKDLPKKFKTKNESRERFELRGTGVNAITLFFSNTDDEVGK